MFVNGDGELQTVITLNQSLNSYHSEPVSLNLFT